MNTGYHFFLETVIFKITIFLFDISELEDIVVQPLIEMGHSNLLTRPNVVSEGH